MSRIAVSKMTAFAVTMTFCVLSAKAQDAPPRQDDAKPTTEVAGEVIGPEAPKAAGPIAPEEVPPPDITPGPELSLAEALKMVSERNLDLQTAEMEVEKARAGFKKSLGMVLPVVQATLDYTRMDHEDTTDLVGSLSPLLEAMGISLDGIEISPLLTNTQDTLVGALQAHIPIINAEAWLTIGAAKKGVDAARLSIEQIRRQLLLGTAQAYFMALTYRDLVSFYNTQIATAEEQLRIAEARFNAGRGMRIDVIRAETDVEKSKQSLVSAKLAFDNARDALGDLVDMEDGLPLPVDAPSLWVPNDAPQDLEDQAVKTRIDIKADAAKVELAKKQKNAAWMQFLPTLNLVLKGSYQFTDFPDLGSEDPSRGALMLSLTVPIYNHFRYGDLDEKRAGLRQAELSLQRSKDKACLEVRKAIRNYETSLASVAIAQKQAALAAEGLKLTEASYLAGSGDSLSVTNARQTHIAAGFNLTTEEFKSQLSLLGLLDAIGENLDESVAAE